MSDQNEKVSKNLQAILDWCETYRPDLRLVVWAERFNDGFILLMQVGFEAGRMYQAKSGAPLEDKNYSVPDDPIPVETPPTPEEEPPPPPDEEPA